MCLIYKQFQLERAYELRAYKRKCIYYTIGLYNVFENNAPSDALFFEFYSPLLSLTRHA